MGSLGDPAGARVQLERALVISEAALDPDHATVATIRRNLDSLLQALQEPPSERPASADQRRCSIWAHVRDRQSSRTDTKTLFFLRASLKHMRRTTNGLQYRIAVAHSASPYSLA